MVQNFGRGIVSSAALCYNKANEKASPFGRGGGEADGEGKLLQRLPSHPLPRELSLRESLRTRNRRGMGIARSLCNTKAKLAMKEDDK